MKRKEPAKEYRNFIDPAKAAAAGRKGAESLLRKYGSNYFRQLVQKREDRKRSYQQVGLQRGNKRVK